MRNSHGSRMSQKGKQTLLTPGMPLPCATEDSSMHRVRARKRSHRQGNPTRSSKGPRLLANLRRRGLLITVAKNLKIIRVVRSVIINLRIKMDKVHLRSTSRFKINNRERAARQKIKSSQAHQILHKNPSLKKEAKRHRQRKLLSSSPRNTCSISWLLKRYRSATLSHLLSF